MKRDNKLFITEISEEDFKKLNLKVVAVDPFTSTTYKDVELNNVLDTYLEHCKYIPSTACVPVTVAIFDEWPDGENSFKVKFGLRHLYSTRDYYQARDGSWKVKKNCLKAIYRVHLNMYK